MSNNTVLPAGNGGDTIADEDIGGVKYQQIKLIDSTVGSTTPVGTAANPLPVTANQGGTWTVQPGNTPNTVAWKVDGSAVTQPVSGTFWQSTQPISGAVTQGNNPWIVQNDERQYDDDGIPYVNPNVPGADIATGDKQTQQLQVLQQLATLTPVSVQGTVPVSVGTVSTALSPNASIETAGNLQKIADTLETDIAHFPTWSAAS